MNNTIQKSIMSVIAVMVLSSGSVFGAIFFSPSDNPDGSVLASEESELPILVFPKKGDQEIKITRLDGIGTSNGSRPEGAVDITISSTEQCFLIRKDGKQYVLQSSEKVFLVSDAGYFLPVPEDEKKEIYKLSNLLQRTKRLDVISAEKKKKGKTYQMPPYWWTYVSLFVGVVILFVLIVLIFMVRSIRIKESS